MKKYIKGIVTHPLFSGSAIMVIGSNSVSFINYLYHLVMGRMLGPAGYGELASLIALIGLVGIIPGSVSLVIVKQVSSARSDQEISNVIGWLKAKIFLAAVIFSISVLVISPFIASFLNIHKTSYLIFIAVSFLFSLQAGLFRAILQGLLKFKEMIFSMLIENSAKFILSISLVYLGFQVSGVMFSLVISAILGLYITNYYLRYRTVNNTKPSSHVKSMMSFLIPFTLQSVAITSLYSSDVILVKHFFPAHEAGIYAALSTLGKIIFFGTGPINTVMFPLVSQRKAKGQDYKKIFKYSFLMTALGAIFVSGLYWLFPTFAINLLYGSAYLEAKNLLIWFAVFISLFTLGSLLVSYLLSLGKTKVVVFPLTAATLQIIAIIFFHQNLLTVISISIIITALLLVALLIYSIYGNKINFSNRPML
ncbi:MAG: oligosaccharide flippase family protein [Candidatus Daviesbacteria bacterium]|nr:oligosaccharide flippase family protein [Candidatus Daviesbacteria bacterium]